MAKFEELDFEPIARQVYDDFLVSLPGVAVEGLFVLNGQYFIVSPALGTKLETGEAAGAWFENSRMPAGMPISLEGRRPDGARELPPRGPDQVQIGFGVVRTRNDVARELAVRLPPSFPLVSVAVEDRVLIVTVSRSLQEGEQRDLDATVHDAGDPLPMEVRVDAATGASPAARADRLELVPARLQPGLPRAVREFLEEDEAFWRDNYRRALNGKLTPDAILGEARRPLGKSACLVATTFPTSNVRSYLSLYDLVVLVSPLDGQVDGVLSTLGVTRRDFIELIDRKKIRLVLPQSIGRYDAGFLAEVLEVAPEAMTGSRRLAAASHADQMTKNPLLVFQGSALDRRTLLRACRRLAESSAETRRVMEAVAEGLAQAWPSYEHLLHGMGAMASITGPLAQVSRALAKRLTGNDYFIELGAAAQNVEWASAFGAHYAPFEDETYTEVGHAGLLLAVHTGVPRSAPQFARPVEFEVAEDLLVVDSDVDIIDFITVLGQGDIARFRDLVRGIARPGRSAAEVTELVEMWNRAVRAYDRKPDRLKSMGVGGLLLGTGAKLVGAPDLVALSAVVAPFLPALLTHVQENLVGEHASPGKLVDDLNARLAGVPRDAVLLARLKKLVKGMK